MCYEQKMTSLAATENWRFWRIPEKAKKRPEEARKRPEEARKRQEEARRGQKRRGRGQKRPGRGQEEARVFEKRHQNARNPEFGEKRLETQCFMNRK